MKRVVVTGASSGIGAEVARMGSARGWGLVLVARREGLLRELADECLAGGASGVRVVCADVADCGGAVVVGEALRELGAGEPCLVNNAGMARFGDFGGTDWVEHSRQVEVNFLGAMAAAHAFVPVALEHGSGCLVNVLSVAAETAFAGAAVYGATKAGLRQFGRSLHAEYRGRGLRVTNVLPGATDTPLWDLVGGGPERGKMIPARGVAEVVVWALEVPADRAVEEVVVTPPLGVL